MDRLAEWFRRKGRTPFDYQRRAWDAYLSGRSGLIHAPTGTGKTQAAWGGPIVEWLKEHPEGEATEAPSRAGPGLRVLWITPLRALANDTLQALQEPIEALKIPWRVESRTSDTSPALRKRQRTAPPAAMVTTPESLSLLLSYADTAASLVGLRAVILDEWHELLGTKRGVQAQLAIARLRRLSPGLRVWGLSATLGNLDEAMAVLLGPGHGSSPECAGVLIHGQMPKSTRVYTLRPPSIDRFPWAGHLGTRLVKPVIRSIERANSTLLFTNTRSQAELWFQSMIRTRPDLIGQVALHHGSLDMDIRQRVEEMLRTGRLRCVVCTSSLDLGVDFSPVDQVLQLGSPKGIARFLQRAGRSGHRPGARSEIWGVPTHAMELVEFSAAREALAERRVESRVPPDRPLDVLVQHLVTLAAGGGFDEAETCAEVRSTHAYASLSEQEWGWAMDFVTRGGPSLHAYPNFARVVREGARARIASARVERLHRMGIGTIVADAEIRVAYANGKSLGTIEESFIGRLKEGDRFIFAGGVLEFVRLRNMVATVRPARSRSGVVVRWGGGRSPLSTELAHAVRARLGLARDGKFPDAEMRAMRPILELQRRWSRLPGEGDLLAEHVQTEQGHHAFLFPFEGRAVHEGLAALLAYRLTRLAPRSVTTSATDYGLELLSPTPLELSPQRWRELLSQEHLLEDLLACLNVTELAKRRFREIARIAGLIFTGYPGQAQSARQLQASSTLFFDVFSEHDPGNLLIDQARREVLERELEVSRLRQTLARLALLELHIVEPGSLTPLAFPIWAESLRSQTVSSENWGDRVRRMVAELEHKADGRPAPDRAPAEPRTVRGQRGTVERRNVR